MLNRLVAGRVGDVALLDGGMGTFLETQGVAEPWSSGYLIDDPDVNAAVKLGYTTFLKSGVSSTQCAACREGAACGCWQHIYPLPLASELLRSPRSLSHSHFVFLSFFLNTLG